MKPILVIGLFSTVFQSCFAQEKFTFHNDIHPKISGKISGYDPAADPDLVMTFHSVVPEPKAQVERSVPLQKDGTFEFTPNYSIRNQQFWLAVGDYYFGELLLDKGLTVDVDLEAQFLQETPSPYAWILENERLSDMYGDIFVVHWYREMPDDLLAEAVNHQPRLCSNSFLPRVPGCRRATNTSR